MHHSLKAACRVGWDITLACPMLHLCACFLKNCVCLFRNLSRQFSRKEWLCWTEKGEVCRELPMCGCIDLESVDV